MHISSAALCSAHTLDLTETNPAPRVAIKSATYFSCGGVRSRSGWHYNAVQRCGHVKSEILDSGNRGEAITKPFLIRRNQVQSPIHQL